MRSGKVLVSVEKRRRFDGVVRWESAREDGTMGLTRGSQETYTLRRDSGVGSTIQITGADLDGPFRARG